MQGGLHPVLLDGDRLRAILNAEGSHAPADRLRLAMIYARLCHELSEQGHTVICSTVSMFHAVHQWNRNNITSYHEVYLRVPRDELVRRDPKGLYAATAEGKAGHMVGIHSAPEEPESPDLVIDNYGTVTVDEAVDAIWRLCFKEDVNDEG